MTDSTDQQGSQPAKRLTRIVVRVLFILAFVGTTGLYATASTRTLMLTCISDASSLPSSLACTWLKQIRKPDPNEAITPGLPVTQTSLAFLLANDGTNSSKHDALLQHFVEQGIDWEKPHSGIFSPLFMAIVDRDPGLLQKFLDAGAPPQSKIEAPGKRLHQLNALDFTRMLKTKVSQNDATGEAKILLEMEKILLKAGLVATPAPEPAPASDAGPAGQAPSAPDAGPAPDVSN
jgi:hypothetical protein